MRSEAEGQGASAWTKFRLLMWKNFLQQVRHPLQTATELLLPVVTMCLVLLLRWQIEPEMRPEVVFPSFPAHTLNSSLDILFAMDRMDLSVAYSPESEVIDDVVRTSVANLLVRNAYDLAKTFWDILDLNEITLPPDIDFPDLENINSTVYEIIKRLIRVDAYKTSAELRSIYADEETTKRVIAAVEFDDKLFGATELPEHITYSLRFPERPRYNYFFASGSRTWRTDLLFPVFELPGPRSSNRNGGRDPGYVTEMFIALQHMISSTLVSKLTGDNLLAFDVQLQRYPHPPYISDFVVEALQLMFALFIMLSFSYTAVNITRAVTVEKELQLKETLKIMGLPTWIHWTAWFCKQFLYLLVASVLIIIVLKVNWFSNENGFSEYAVFTNTPWSVLLFYLLLYLACMIFFCFMLSGFFSQGSTASLFAGIVWFLTYIPAFMLAMDISMSVPVQIFTCLSINSAMSYGFQLMLARESTGGLQWGEFMAAPSVGSSRLLFGHVVIMLAVDCVLYMLVALYLEQVLPGPYGTPKKWYFLFQKQYWFPNSKVESDGTDLKIPITPQVMKELDPLGLSVGVKMTNLTKVFGKHVAVNDLSLNIYDDQITVLLGHNGAGKSTTISMLTGNLPVTQGSVWVAGHDMSWHSNEARRHIGLCPQHNVLFNELTVKEHLEFFARLKGYTGEKLRQETDSLIEKLELQEKRDYQAHGLSGGQKRRLCVGIALSGDARVVLLDEPTSGMDPSSRRALWDLLQKEKHGRSMILTTHFMDEADILGDRIAIMASGQLQCVGSPYFLKRHYGVGYTLVIVKDEGFDEEACTELINSHIPNTPLKEDRGTEVTYNLKNEYSHIYEVMLNDLESNTVTIKFKNYGLLATTLEDVFMSVGSDVHTEIDDAETVIESVSDETTRSNEFDATSIDRLNEEESLSGFGLVWQHAVAIWLKLWLVWSRSWGMVLLQVLVPTLQINATLGVLRYVTSFTPTIQRRSLSLADGYTSTESLLSFNGSSLSTLGGLAWTAYEAMISGLDAANRVVTVVDEPIHDYYMNISADAVAMGGIRHRVLAGATFSDDSATAWFSNFGYHDVATSLAAVHSALLKARHPTAEIKVFNHPLEVNYRDQTDMQLMVQMMSMQLAAGIGSSLGISCAVFVMFYIKERVSRAKLLQKSAGIQPVVMWGSAAVFDWLWFLIICLTIVVSCVAFNVMGLSTPAELGRLYICLMVYGAAMLPMNYLFSHLFNGPAMGFVVVFFINVLIGMMGPQIVEALSQPHLRTVEAASVMDSVLQFFPLYSLVSAIRSLNHYGMTVASCELACEYLSAVLSVAECSMQFMCEEYSEACCVRDNPFFEWEEPGVLRYITVMLVTCIVCWAIFFVIEYRLLQKLFTRQRTPPPVDESTVDTDVLDESRHVDRVGPGVAALSHASHASLAGHVARDGHAGREARTPHSLVARGMSKYYGKHLAVNQVSFTVSDSECFGLLGVNGAGKTTTFKMLMGDEAISSGDAFVSGHSVRKQITKVHENIGYCPQFDAVFGELTGRETLRLFALLRGLSSQHTAARTAALANSLGFAKHLDKRVHQYSGGNKRKLSTAVALLGRTRLVFVDEPTTGVDPAAKRQVWRAIRSAQRAGRSVVLTSHSMEECEALCSRLTIMVNGRFQCLGTPQHLKNKFSEGFTLTIKMKIEDPQHQHAPSTSTRIALAPTDVVKQYVEDNFVEPKLMEEYQGLLTYYLSDRSIAWSKMFGIMERAKREISVEDYSISQTTLEQIFLQFTKYQQESISTVNTINTMQSEA